MFHGVEPGFDPGIDSFLRIMDEIEIPAFVVGRDGSLLFANGVWRRWFGAPPRVPWSLLAPIANGDRTRVQRVLDRSLSASRGSDFEFEARRSDGTTCAVACSASVVKLPGLEDLVLLGLCWDISDRRRNEERLAFMAGHDPLTGLFNRRAFDEALQRAVSRAGRGAVSCLLILDLDHLKAYNDLRGHLEGDQALVNAALLIRTHVRATDLPARIGGDEFAVLLEDTSLAEAVEIAERMRHAAANGDFVAGAREVGLGFSGGIAEIEAGLDVYAVVDRADAALYAAKSVGRNRILAWTPEIGGTASPERAATRVREAFAADGFFLVFQPVVDLADGTVTYFESLVRMRIEDGSTQGPGEFLPAVDRLGLMPKLTRRVVDLALNELSAIRGTRLSVNLSPTDLGDATLLADVEHAIESSQVEHERLLFELSESALLANLAGGRAWMTRLAPLGCHFVLDEFGTGVGMFVLLRERHVTQVKLSRLAMRALAAESGSRAFVLALRELIESQEKTAVASFIETRALLGDAKEAGFVLAQGFGVAEPSENLQMLVDVFGVSAT